MSLEGCDTLGGSSGPKRLRFVSEKELEKQRQEREARGETEAPYNPDDQSLQLSRTHTVPLGLCPCGNMLCWRCWWGDGTEPLWQRLQEQKEAAEAAQQELFANRLCCCCS